jgi:uncharacterized protein
MKVVLFGATGMIGSRVLKELVSRGHEVTAVVRDTTRVSNEPGVKAVKGDALNAAEVAKVVKGADAVISSYSPWSEYGTHH